MVRFPSSFAGRDRLSHSIPPAIAAIIITTSTTCHEDCPMSPKPITENTLFYGDNLPIMREYIADESVDLVYLDPPFNSNRNYNVLFKNESGAEAESQIMAFEDTWHWNH